MPDIAPPLEFLRSLCRAVGIDPDADPVKSITITAVAGDIPRITVERYPTTAELITISKAARKACHELGVKPEFIEVTTSTGIVHHVASVPSDGG